MFVDTGKICVRNYDNDVLGVNDDWEGAQGSLWCVGNVLFIAV